VETNVILQSNSVERIVFHFNKSTFSNYLLEKVMQIYIYSLSDPSTGEIRYIGKTNNLKTRFSNHMTAKRKTHLYNWIYKLKENNLKPVIEVVEECDDNNWDISERYWIAQFKAWGFNLVNHTAGGEGVFGYVHSAETKKQLSLQTPWNKGRKYSFDERNKMSEEQKGKKHSEQTKKKFSEIRTGLKYSKEWCKNIGDALSKVQQGKKRGTYKESQIRDNAVRSYKSSEKGIEDTLSSAKKRRKYDRPTYEQLMKDYNELGTYKKVAEKYGVERKETIGDWFKFYKKYNGDNI